MATLNVKNPEQMQSLINTARKLRDPHRAVQEAEVRRLAPKQAEAKKAQSAQAPQLAEIPKPQQLKVNNAPELDREAPQSYEQCSGTLTLLSVLMPQAKEIINAAIKEQQALAQLS